MTEIDQLNGMPGDRSPQQRGRSLALAKAAVRFNEHVIIFEREEVDSEPPIDSSRTPEEGLGLGSDEVLPD